MVDITEASRNATRQRLERLRAGLASLGVDGFIVPIRSADAVTEKLSALSDSPSLLAAMKEAALQKARALRWEDYRSTIARMVQSQIARRPPARCMFP